MMNLMILPNRIEVLAIAQQTVAGRLCSFCSELQLRELQIASRLGSSVRG